MTAAFLSACSTQDEQPVEPERFDMTVEVAVAPGHVTGVDGGGCAGDGRLSGLREGAYVTVSDAVGATVGAGNLEQGVIGSDQRCTLSSSISVIEGSDFVEVEVGDYGSVTRSVEEARREGVGIGFGF